jgi:ABC-type polar amino acid transport system ATPase subunit
MDVSDFTVLTGPQASGKTTIAKAIYLFRSVKEDVLELLGMEQSQSDFNVLLRQMFLRKFQGLFGDTHSEKMRIRYMYDDDNQIEIQSKCVKKSIVQPVWLTAFNAHVHWPTVVSHQTFFIPAGRTVSTQLASSLAFILAKLSDEQKSQLDYATRTYLEKILEHQYSFRHGWAGLDDLAEDKATLDAAKQLGARILGGEYQYLKWQGEYIILPDGKEIQIHLASSGQQEAVWVLNFLYRALAKDEKTFFIIEEPESHLFPEAQNDMMQFVSLIKNAGHQMLITTHSPYVLASVNNLLYAHQVGQKKPEETRKIIGEKLWLNPKTFAGLHVCNGKPENAMDAETQLFRNELIDGVSAKINGEFDALLELNYTGVD